MKKPVARDYYTDDGLHADMLIWAEEQDKTRLKVIVTFDDGSIYNEIFERATKEISYKTRDREEYAVTVDTGKFEGSQFFTYEEEKYLDEIGKSTSMTVGQLKKAFINSLEFKYSSIKWEYIK